jgi:hypothetical protein
MFAESGGPAAKAFSALLSHEIVINNGVLLEAPGV